MATSQPRKGCPRRPEGIKRVKLRVSTYNLWIERKEALGVQGITNSEFAEMLLHQNLGIARDRDHNRSSDFVLPGTATQTQGKTSQDNFKSELEICVSLSHYLGKLSFLFNLRHRKSKHFQFA